MPGDPFTFLSAEEGQDHTAFSSEDIERHKKYYGLDQPLWQQYISYVRNLLKGDLGYSIHYKEEVLTLVLSRIAWTLSLVIASVLLSAAIGVFLGTISAYYRNSSLDKILYSGLITLSEVPSFIIALVMLFYFAAHLKLFPLSGGMSHFVDFSSRWEMIKDILLHAFLPLMALTITRIGEFYLLARNSMISILDKAYIKTARGKGLKRRRILFYHALRNAIPPIVTRIFLSFGGALGGAVLVENVFNYPGVGRLMRQGVFFRDYPLIQGIFVVMTLFVLVMNYTADAIYKKLDPRVS